MTTKSTRTKAQQAELDKLRAEKEAKAKRAQSKAEAISVDVIGEKPKFNPEEAAAKVRAKLAAMWAEVESDVGLNMQVSGKRRFAAFFACVALSVGAGHAIGTFASYAIVGLSTLGGAPLWAFVISMIAMMLAIYVSLKISQVVGGYILSGQIDRDAVAAKDKVMGWFKRKPMTVAA